jgi:hypothetical protein
MKIQHDSRGPLRRLLDRLEDRLFSADDARARRRGWEVRSGPNGRGRVYRDPRWDSVRCCDDCGGTGLNPIDREGCVPCSGTGVLRPERAPAGAGCAGADRMGGKP